MFPWFLSLDFGLISGPSIEPRGAPGRPSCSIQSYDLLVVQVSVDHTELEDARWFSLEEITSALQVKAPLSRGKPAAGFWLPPKHAIANHLITEWTHRQRAQSTI